jgi:hypothetical protein
MREWPLLMMERSYVRFGSLAGEADARTISHWPPGSIHANIFILFPDNDPILIYLLVFWTAYTLLLI